MNRLMKIALALCVGAFVGVAASFGGSLPGFGGSNQESARATADIGRLSVKQLHAFADFPLYAPSSPVHGLNLTRSSRISPAGLAEAAKAVPPIPVKGTPKNQPESRGHKMVPDFVSMIYGDCVASGDNGCGPPLEIQTWRSCNRSLSDYELGPGVPLPHENLIIRGVHAAQFDDRLELYTGKVTIVVFADRALARDVAAALRPMNAAAAAEVAGRKNGTLAPSAPGPDCA